MSLEWWQKTVFYHVYLPSFKDSNDDGVGDIQGLISKLDYFKELEVDTLLMSPFFPSPQKDNGYDISSYVDIDPVYGTMDDFHQLMQELKKRDMHIILDFVSNHTSDQHQWFKNSIDSIAPYTDFFVWEDPKPGKKPIEPPNNWLSVFGGSAWEWNPKRKKYYLHQFLVEQPDLNFRNPAVRKEVKKILEFWLEKGVDGFRVDAASHLFEDEALRDEPVDEESKAKPDEHSYLKHIYTKGHVDNLLLMEEWRGVLDEYEAKTGISKVIVVEVFESLEDTMRYYGSVNQRLADFPFNFKLYDIEPAATGFDLYRNLDDWLSHMPKGKYSNYVMSSHDYARVATRLGRTLAGSLQMVTMLLPGTPVTYFGEELGMINGKVKPDEIRDQFALRTKLENSRDPVRTPMPWSNEPNAGFSNAKPWLPLNPDYKTVNVKTLSEDPFSNLSNYKRLVRLRQEASILLGSLEYPLVTEEIFSFIRFLIGTKCYLIVVNMSSDPIRANLFGSPYLPKEAYVEVSNNPFYFQGGSSQGTAETKVRLSDIYLEPKQAVVLSYLGSIDSSDM